MVLKIFHQQKPYNFNAIQSTKESPWCNGHLNKMASMLVDRFTRNAQTSVSTNSHTVHPILAMNLHLPAIDLLLPKDYNVAHH